MIKVNYKIKEVKPKVLLVEFEDQYDMCMTFWRVQETYESPNPKFRNKDFTLVEFMRWYSKAFGNGSFTYANDWGGFNVPSDVVEFVLRCPFEGNEYDDVMEEIYYKCHDIVSEDDPPFSGEPKFYLIGALKGSDQVIKHEIAHGLWYTVPKYKKEMLALVKKMKPSLRKKLCQELVKLGYTKKVFDDECHAYMSTGLSEKSEIVLKGEDKPFIEIFKKYYEK